MRMRRLINLPKNLQAELRCQYPWLKAVAWNDQHPKNLQGMAITVFDHWLSREEANELLENVSPDEQDNRNDRHTKFCALLVAGTPVLSFRLSGRKHDRAVFRRFTSAEALSKYCRPSGSQTLGHRQFQVVLPELGCAFFESWDDTHHFYFTNSAALGPIHEWAGQSGLFVLEHG